MEDPKKLDQEQEDIDKDDFNTGSQDGDDQDDDDSSGDEDSADYWKAKYERANAKVWVLKKAEKDRKKSQTDQSHTTFDEKSMDALLEKKLFYKSNPQARELEKDIEKAIKKAEALGADLTREEALASLSQKKEEQKASADTSLKGKESTDTGFKRLTQAQYDKLTSSPDIDDRKKAHQYAIDSRKEYGALKFK